MSSVSPAPTDISLLCRFADGGDDTSDSGVFGSFFSSQLFAEPVAVLDGCTGPPFANDVSDGTPEDVVVVVVVIAPDEDVVSGGGTVDDADADSVAEDDDSSDGVVVAAVVECSLVAYTSG